MVNFIKNIDAKSIIILGLIIVILMLKMCTTNVSHDGKTVKIGGRTYTVIKHEVDTVTVPVKQIVYKKGDDIYHEKIVLVDNKIHELDTNKVVTDYYSQVVYKDTLKLNDSLGYISVLDTIYKNSLLNRKWESHVNKTIIKDITFLKETPKNEFFIGGVTGYNTNRSVYLGPAIMFKNKQGTSFSLGLGVSTTKDILIQGSIYKKLTFNK